MTNESTIETQALYLGLLNALGEVSKWRNAVKDGPLSGVIEAHDNLIEAWLDVRDLAHRLANVDGERALVMMLLEEQATGELKRLTSYDEYKAATAAAGV